MTDTGLYVYAVARDLSEADLDQVTGLGSVPLRIVTHRGLDAVVSEVGLDEFGDDALRRNLEDLQWLERVARSHDAVTRGVSSAAASAPLRLATICLSTERVQALLDEWHDALVSALDRVQGRDEWSVKLLVTRGANHGSTVSSGAGTDERPGAAYLQRRRTAAEDKARAAAEAEALAEDVHAQLSGSVVASRRLALQDARLSGLQGTMVLNGAYLVDRDRTSAFTDLTGRLAAAHPSLQVEVQGPWPPYSFATLEAP
ncbi:MAG: GvpL/GvpF family gas vesicle protein [Nocardioidaceae bacterium]